MIVIDYSFMILLIVLACFNFELVSLAIAWIAQLAISTGFYYWKAKNENRLKIPMEILKTLDGIDESSLDVNQIITTILEKD